MVIVAVACVLGPDRLNGRILAYTFVSIVKFNPFIDNYFSAHLKIVYLVFLLHSRCN